MSKQQHTPWPWYVPHHAPCSIWTWTHDIRQGVQVATVRVSDDVDGNLSPKNSPIKSAEAEANAAFIVRAVNSHAPLVEALEAVLAEYREGYGLHCVEQVRAALAAAKGAA